MTRLLVAVLVVLAAAVSCSPTKAADPTIVTTRAGAVRGHIDDQVRVFAAIPYAAPPVGPRRFAEPGPVTPWPDTRDATGPGVECPQPGPEVLQSNDQLGLRFEKTSTPQPEGATTTVTVRTGDGKVVQTISEPFKGWLGGAAVELLDIDQDGRDDLLVQVDARVKDGKWAIWHAVGSNPKLSRVGVVDGHPESAGPGLIKADTEQGAAFYVIKGNALAPAPAPAA